MQKTVKTILLSVTMIALSACSTAFRSTVTSFHELPAASIGKTIAIVPMDKKKREGLEFRNYAALVGAELEKVGYKPAGDAKPDYIVGLDYQVNDGREKLRNRPSARIGVGYWGYYSGFGAWGIYNTPFSHTHESPLSVSTVFKTNVTLEIRKPDGEKIYEVRAETEGRNGYLTRNVPLLVEAIFKDFPGENGKPRIIRIEQEK